MRNKILLFLGMVLVFGLLGACPEVAAQKGPQGMQANLNNISVPDFLKFVVNYTGQNIVYREDQVPKFKVNLYSREPITESELMAILRHVLQNAGLDMVAKGDILYVVPSSQAGNVEDTLYVKPAPGVEDELVTTVYRLDSDVSAIMAAKLVSPFTSKNIGKVVGIPEAHALFIRDKRSRVGKMLDLLKIFRDIRPQWETDVLRMKRVKASEAQSVISNFYKELTAKGQHGEPPLVLAVEWSNSLIVAGPPDQVQAVKNLLARLETDEQATTNYKIYRLRNAKASSVDKVLTALAGKLAEKKDGKPSSPGKESFLVSSDEDTNSLIVLGEPDFLAQVDDIVSRLDRVQDQVFVEALIMETSLTNAQRFGVEWLAGLGSSRYSGSTGFIDGGSESALIKYQDDGPNFGAMPGGFSVGVLGNLITYGDKSFPTLSMLAGFLRTAAGVNLLSTPQILTLDNSEAEIFVGQNRAFITGSKSATDTAIINTYEYRDVGKKLKVTPHINAKDNLIRLDLELEVKDVVANTGEDRPVTLNRNARTSVQLVNGATMAIGGLIQDDTDRSQKSVPGISRIPVLGWLFKRRSNSAEKRTLMFFITARIIHTREDALRLGREKMEQVEKQNRETRKAINKEFGIDDQEPDGEDVDTMSEEPLEEESILPPVEQESETAPLEH